MATMTKSNIKPSIWLEGNAEEAARFYTSIFPDGRIDGISPIVVEFHIDGQDIMAINGNPTGAEPLQSPVPGSSALFVTCDMQEKVDRLWEALSQGGRTMMCGWLADKFGVVWNIVPEGLRNYIAGPDETRAQRAMQTMLGQVKLDLAAIATAYEGKN
jgi:predicted 3-demethylubiquinone-9 3-methyltransferase (glyoxalase superfamily)